MKNPDTFAHTGRIGDWLTVEAAASLTGYNVQHLRRLCAAGTLEARPLGRNWLIALSSLLLYATVIDRKHDRRYGAHHPPLDTTI